MMSKAFPIPVGSKPDTCAQWSSDSLETDGAARRSDGTSYWLLKGATVLLNDYSKQIYYYIWC